MPSKTKKSTDTMPNRQTRSATKPQRDAALKAQLEAELKAAQEKADERAKALAEQLKNPPAPGNRGDGGFHMAFIRMGQGDCTIISTPEGRTLMIDCGSDATESDDQTAYVKKIRDTVYGPKFMKGSKDLDYLILTHPDSDHYNKLHLVLDADVKIHNIYHSSKLENYFVSNQSAWLTERADSLLVINSVTLRYDLDELGKPKWVKKLGPVSVSTDMLKTPPHLDARGAIRILTEPDCQVSLLAGNVALPVDDNSTPANRGSVVTLIETFDKNILICGDATRATEAFIMNTYKDLWPAKLDLMQIPHHGSSLTSSSDDLVNWLKPEKTVISAGKNVAKDHLPSITAMDKYLTHHTDNAVLNHEIFYWEPAAMGSYINSSKFYTKALYVTGSNYTQELTLKNKADKLELKPLP